MSGGVPGSRAARGLEKAIVAWVDDNRLSALALLKELVRTPSYSGEEGVASDRSTMQGKVFAVADSHAGTRVESQRVSANSENVIEWLPGAGSRALVLDAHTDIVPEGAPEGWFEANAFSGAEGTIEYLGEARVRLEVGGHVADAQIRDRMDRVWRKRSSSTRSIVYGRGSFDNKGAVVATSLAMGALSEVLTSLGLGLAGSVIAAYSVDEEAGEGGVRAVVGGLDSWLGRRGYLGGPLGNDGLLLEVAGIALDGSYGWMPVVGHRGAVQLALSTRGRSAHAATPHVGVNAVIEMARLLTALSGEESELIRRLTELGDPSLLGLPTTAIGTTIVGGGVRAVSIGQDGIEIDRSGVNAIPDWCEATIDVRFPPSYDLAPVEVATAITAAVERFLAARFDPDGWSYSLRQIEGAFTPPVAMARTLQEAESHPLVRVALRRAEQVLELSPHLETAPGGTNATRMVHEGRIPTLVEFGPAGALSHDTHEFVEVESVIEGAKILSLMALDILGIVE
jgi:acetylornithine deacetylase/succinyl-diaminopimelate desuccinylase-like protein